MEVLSAKPRLCLLLDHLSKVKVALNLVRQVPDKRSIKDAASAPRGTQNTCWRYWGRCNVNLDSLP